MTKKTLSALALAVLVATGAAWAAGPGCPPGPMPHGPDGPHPGPGPGIPSAEMLATADDLSATQQADIRKILRERRDAEDALRSRLRGEREAIDQRERTERERIEDQSAQKLRAALGEDGYRAYARWMSQRGPGPLPPRPAPGARDDRGAPRVEGKP
ncbi:periplasmic heavy metal sensor [Dokdonella sp.]|uniref:periplasmic heavy metal sensor n=1 Tax=Dokdonella sp. TaxID=2291710 RepID=UPI001B183FE0|nr:periplasmic heavy metal sensor [Dokdonella sp.]MBO9663301.1 hypothetical protein [Dokdonella sp.]